ncbi:uncharacterized protein LOC131207963 [Anopheles bellator]|uniref:uncharacterized protein LOC131207963 n=1 Tax=Anopheles bellator TaxID=139047 RepID=UPI0026487502|nr:uncharacterized protein LOC131207963 [Anopheles bellator]
MKASFGWLILGLWCQHAFGSPRPDFGLHGSVAGSASVVTVAGEAATLFDLIDRKTITLNSQYNTLYTLKDALTEIGSEIAIAGQTLTSQLETLANSTGPLLDAFNNVTSALGNLSTVLTGNLTSQQSAIEQAVGPAIGLMLSDALNRLTATLHRLEESLNKAKLGAIDAQHAYGSAPIPATDIRRYITPKIIDTLQRAEQDMKSDLPLVTYIIELTLGHLEAADIYLSGFMSGADDAVQDAVSYFSPFYVEASEDAVATGEMVFTDIQTAYKNQTTQLNFIMADLAAMDSYATAMQLVFAKYANAIDDARLQLLYDSIGTMFTTYFGLAAQLDDFLDQFLDVMLCEPVRAVLDVLIASGPWADYCFSKYSPRLSALAIVLSYDFQECYQIEATRLQRLFTLTERMVTQMLFDVADLADNVLDCFYQIAGASDCYAQIGPYYIELADTLALKKGDLEQLIDFETNANAARMGSCVSTAKYNMVLSAEAIVSAIGQCETSGPSH